MSLAGPADLDLDGGQLGLPADEGRLGEGVAGVLGADHDVGIVVAGLEGGGDLVQVGQRGAGRAVAVGGLLHQQSLDDVIEGAGHGVAEAAQAGDRLGHVLAEDLPDRLAQEDRAPGQALEEDGAGGVEVGALVDPVGDDSGGLGRGVAGGPEPALRGRADRPAKLGDTEVNQCRPLDGAGGLGADEADDDVRRPDVAVEEAVLVGLSQRGEHVPADDQGLGDGEAGRGRAQMGLEGHPGHVRLHPVEDAALAAGFDGTDEVGALEHREGGELLLEAVAGCRIGGHDGADDDLAPVDGVEATEGLAGRARLEDARRPVARAEPSGPVLLGRYGCGRGVHPPGYGGVSFEPRFSLYLSVRRAGALSAGPDSVTVGR